MRSSVVSLSLLCLLLSGPTLALAQGSSEGATPDAAATKADTASSVSVVAPPAPATLSSEEIKKLIRQAAENDLENDKKLRDYTYSEREEEHRLNGKGEVASTETRTYDVLEIFGEQARRMVSKNDKPLSAKDAAKEEEKIQKIIDKRKNESNSEREKRLKKEEKDREEGRQFVKEIAEAYNFTQLGNETVDGRDTYVIAAEPRPGFEPHRKEAKVLTKIRGKIWIDVAESQWVKLDAETIDTISFGLFLARLHKGTHILTEETRVNDEVWLPRHTTVHIDVRVALLKNFNINLDVSDKDYKKFHTESKIVGVEEVRETH